MKNLKEKSKCLAISKWENTDFKFTQHWLFDKEFLCSVARIPCVLGWWEGVDMSQKVTVQVRTSCSLEISLCERQDCSWGQLDSIHVASWKFSETPAFPLPFFYLLPHTWTFLFFKRCLLTLNMCTMKIQTYLFNSVFPFKKSMYFCADFSLHSVYLVPCL